MTEAQKIAQNTIIQISGKAITIAFALIGFGLMARYLGQEGFGYFSTVYAFLAIFGILIDLGLQMTTTRLISDPAENESQILSNALTIRLIASIIFLGLAPLVVLFFPYAKIIKIGVALAAIGFVFSSLTATLTSLFQKRLIMHKIVIAEVAARIVFLAALIFAVYFNLGLSAIISTLVLESFLAFIVLFYFAGKLISLKPSFQFPVWKKILTATWPIALTIALNLIYFKGDIFIMSLIRSQAEVGLYGAPYRILEVLINIAYLFLGLILPLLATTVAVKNFDKLKVVVQTAFDFLIVLSLPMIVGGYFLGRPIMVLMAGPDFAVSGEIIKILLLATAAIFIASLFGYVVVALGKQKQMIKFYLLNAVISIVGYSIFISQYGYWGAAWMTVFTEAFILITAAYVMKKNINFLPNLKLLVKALLASLIMAVPLYLLPQINFIILIFTGALVYFAALYLLKGFNQQLILELVKTKKDETIEN